MSGSPLAVIVIPIVSFMALGLMLGIVLWSSRRPGGKEHRSRPRWNVAGGAFRGDPRQVVPTRDEEPPETAAWQRRERGQRGDGDGDLAAPHPAAPHAHSLPLR